MGYKFCIPTKEECDPSKQMGILTIFYFCCGGSFGLVIILVILYRIATRGRRQRAYEARVREVRQAQLRLMEHHNKARRVGMRDVSKNRAHKIHKAHKKKEKLQKEENKHPNNPWGPKPEYAASAGHDHRPQNSALELEQYRKYSQQQDEKRRASYKLPQYAQSAYSVNTRSSRSSQRFDPAANLPSGWKVYYNDDGIPYYFNSNSGETTWRHPNAKIKLIIIIYFSFLNMLLIFSYIVSKFVSILFFF